jgi:hypothetical protein
MHGFQKKFFEYSSIETKMFVDEWEKNEQGGVSS